jgi:flagellar basal-body rod modification protein FlgD
MSNVQNNTNTVSDALMASMNPSKKTSTDSASETENRFLKLLIAQMKSQDPLNPMDNAQVTSQMAQLSTVTGINNLNATMSSLQTSMLSGLSLEAASMIGHGVLVPGSTIALSKNQAVFGVDLASDAETVKVTVKDSTGKAIYTMDLGKQAAGIVPIAWDGTTDAGEAKAADGIYTFEIAAASGNQKINATALSFGEVTSVTTGTSGISLNVPNIGSVKLTDIRQIL